MDTTTLIEAYGELGVIGCCMILFGFMITNLIKSQKHQDSELESIRENLASMGEVTHNTQSIILKLHDKIQRTGEQDNNERNRRHESIMKEIDDLSDKISYLQGKSNGRT